MHASYGLLAAPMLALSLTGCGRGADAGRASDALAAVHATGAGEIPAGGTCAFSHDLAGTVAVREASAGAEIAIRRIVDHTGLPQNFLVLEADIDNALATVVGGERIVVYDPALLAGLGDGVEGSDWAALGVVAHEVGHHLIGHTLRAAGDEAGRRADELDADAFAGYVMGRMGATASQAQAVMALVGDDRASATHPAWADRVAAVRRGWSRASVQVDRRAAPVAPAPIPSDGYDEIALDERVGGVDRETINCAFEVYRGVVLQAETVEPEDGRGRVFEVTLDLDGPGRRTFGADQEVLFALDNASRSWFYEISREGRRVEVENSVCGTGGFEALYRIRAL